MLKTAPAAKIGASLSLLPTTRRRWNVPSATDYRRHSGSGASHSLPFTLGSLALAQDDRAFAVLDKLDALEALAIESRKDIDALRDLSLQILRRISAVPPPAAPAVVVPLPTAAPQGRLQLKLLGSFEAQLSSETISHWPSRKARLLLAFIALERGRMVPKDVLIDLFWPDVPLERGSNNLSIAVHQIRSTLGEKRGAGNGWLIVKQGLYGLDQSQVWVDLWDFQQRLAEARRSREPDAVRASLLAAIALCRSGFLESDPYEDWTLEPRRSWAASFNQALSWLATDAAGAGDWLRVMDYAGRILQQERCDEAGHRWLMTAHWRLGNLPQALQQYQLCSESLRAELGVKPSSETRRLYEQIRASQV